LHWFFIYDNAVLKNKFSISVPDLTGGTYESKNILLRVMVAGSEAIIPDAEVYVDGFSKGYTDAQGYIPLTNINQGTHTLVVTAPGYVSTDDDILYNDEFTVY